MTEMSLFGQEPQEAEPEKPKPSTRELSKYVSYYLKNIRPHSTIETRGVIRQIQRLLDGGITLLQMQTALKNYAADPFRKESDPRMVKHIRSFFTKQNILDWQKPIQRPQRPAGRFGRPLGPFDASLDALKRLDEPDEPMPEVHRQPDHDEVF